MALYWTTEADPPVGKGELVFEVFEDGGAVGGGEVIDPIAGSFEFEVGPVDGCVTSEDRVFEHSDSNLLARLSRVD